MGVSVLSIRAAIADFPELRFPGSYSLRFLDIGKALHVGKVVMSSIVAPDPYPVAALCTVVRSSPLYLAVDGRDDRGARTSKDVSAAMLPITTSTLPPVILECAASNHRLAIHRPCSSMIRWLTVPGTSGNEVLSPPSRRKLSDDVKRLFDRMHT